MAYVISVSNLKGGVAKTSTSIALGSALARMNQRVLLVDLDSQADLTLGIGLAPNTVNYSASDLFTPAFLQQHSFSTLITKTQYENLDIIPSNGEILWSEQSTPAFKGSERILKNALALAADLPYDFILIDCPPALGAQTLSALVASNLLLIPTQAEYFSANSLKKMLLVIRMLRQELNPTLDYRVLVTLLDLRNRIQRQVFEQFREGFKDNLLSTFIEIDTKIRESQDARIPIVNYRPNSRSAVRYQSLARELLEMLAGPSQPQAAAQGEGQPVTSEQVLAAAEEHELETAEVVQARCPFLGLQDDLTSATGYPSEQNFCHLAKPPAIPRLDHQRTTCLLSAYVACSMLNAKADEPLPDYLEVPRTSFWSRFKLRG